MLRGDSAVDLSEIDEEDEAKKLMDICGCRSLVENIATLLSSFGDIPEAP
jgi:hypothetical protein